jgi:hypothetical protein
MGDPKPRYIWYGHASSEGGPVLIADLREYPAWGGAEERWTDDAAYRVHFYGPLVAKLPSRLQPSGEGQWHHDAVVQGAHAARDYADALCAAAETLEPTLVARRQERMDPATLMSKAGAALGAAADSPAMQAWLSSWRDHMEAGTDYYAGDERVLHIDAKPDTDYARACEALEGDSAIVRYGPSGASRGVVWELEGPGIARVAIGRDGFLLMRSWLDEDGSSSTRLASSASGRSSA